MQGTRIDLQEKQIGFVQRAQSGGESRIYTHTVSPTLVFVPLSESNMKAKVDLNKELFIKMVDIILSSFWTYLIPNLFLWT